MTVVCRGRAAIRAASTDAAIADSDQRTSAARCYTCSVPTSHPRHTITETPPVREALDDLRARLAGRRIDFAELVVLGAGVKVRQLPDNAVAAHEAAARLATMVRGRAVPVDVEAADEAKHRGLIAD